MSDPWNDVASVRAILGTDREEELRSSFDPSSEAHTATLLELSESERVGLLQRRQRPGYMGGAFHRAVTQLSFEWLRTRSRGALVVFDTLLQGDNPDLTTYWRSTKSKARSASCAMQCVMGTTDARPCHHARTIGDGAEDVLVPADELGAPRPDDDRLLVPVEPIGVRAL